MIAVIVVAAIEMVVAVVVATEVAPVYAVIIHLVHSESWSVAMVVPVVVASLEVAPVPAVFHAPMLVAVGNVVVAVMIVVASSSIVSPTVSTAIRNVDMWSGEIEVVAVGIAGIDTKVPVAGMPGEGTVEVEGGLKSAPLPVEEYVAHVQVAAGPIGAVEVVRCRDAHQIVEVYLEGGLVLGVVEVQFVSHLVGEEEGFPACLFIAHGVAVEQKGEQGGECHDYLFHNRSYLDVQHSLFLLSGAKEQLFFQSCKGKSLKPRGNFPMMASQQSIILRLQCRKGIAGATDRHLGGGEHTIGHHRCAVDTLQVVLGDHVVSEETGRFVLECLVEQAQDALVHQDDSPPSRSFLLLVSYLKSPKPQCLSAFRPLKIRVTTESQRSQNGVRTEAEPTKGRLESTCRRHLEELFGNIQSIHKISVTKIIKNVISFQNHKKMITFASSLCDDGWNCDGR